MAILTPKSNQVRRPSRLILLISLGVVILASLITILVLPKNNGGTEIIEVQKPKITKAELSDLWKNKEYKQVYEASKQFNEAEPYSFDILLFYGFSSYYYGSTFTTEDESLPFYKEAIVSLRKAKNLEPFRNNSDIDYVLGLIYFNLGYYYTDSSYTYLKSANTAGNNSSDLFEHLGVVANLIGNNPEAIGYFERSMNDQNRDSIKLSIAKTYLDLDDVSKAEPYIVEVINNSKDPLVLEKAKFLRAAILTRNKKIDEALEIYSSIVKTNPDSADGHFYMGEMYNEKGDTVKARAEWRTATSLNPKHSGAINRLNSNN